MERKKWCMKEQVRTHNKAGKEVTYIIQEDESGNRRRVYQSRGGKTTVRYLRYD